MGAPRAKCRQAGVLSLGVLLGDGDWPPHRGPGGSGPLPSVEASANSMGVWLRALGRFRDVGEGDCVGEVLSPGQ